MFDVFTESLIEQALESQRAEIPPPIPPELVRQLLGQQPAQSEHCADAI